MRDEADELLAGLLARERRTQDLLTVLSEDGSGDSIGDEGESEEMSVQDIYEEVCALDARLCEAGGGKA